MAPDRADCSHASRIFRSVDGSIAHLYNAVGNMRRRTYSYSRRKSNIWKIDDVLANSLRAIPRVIKKACRRNQHNENSQDLPYQSGRNPPYNHIHESQSVHSQQSQPMQAHVTPQELSRASPGQQDDLSHRSEVASTAGSGMSIRANRQRAPIGRIYDWTTLYDPTDPRSQADPGVFDPISQALLQFEAGNITCTTIQLRHRARLDEMSGAVVSNDSRIADYVNTQARDLGSYSPTAARAPLRSLDRIWDGRYGLPLWQRWKRSLHSAS